MVTELDLALGFSIVACLLILGEWTYVILWTRGVGSKVVSAVIQRMNLRPGRGRGDSPADNLARQGAPQGNAEPQIGPDVLDTPLAQDFINRAAERFGVSPEVARGFAEQMLSDGGAQGPPPMPGGPRAPPQGTNQGPPFAAILQGVLGGQIPIEQALMAAAPAFLESLKRGGVNGGRPGPSASTVYW